MLTPRCEVLTVKLHILQLLLWPEREDFEPSVIEFEPGCVNVITGWSETGKSSIAAIIDYVLGSGTCTIPVGLIRETVSWYGLLIDTDVGLFRVARRKPEQRRVSSEYWVQQGLDAQKPLPLRITKNSTEASFKANMDTLSGLSNLRLSTDEGQAWSERASFRDMAAFNFLPQHIVANPHTMFFKADTSQHREKLRSVLPLALGALTNEDLILMHRLDTLRKTARELQNDLRRLRNSVELWRSNVTGQYYRGQELGLLPSGEPPRELATILLALNRMVRSAARGRQPSDGRRTGRAVERLAEIQKEERKLDREIGDHRRRLRKLQGLSNTIVSYDDVLSDQAARVSGVGWFADMIHDEENCVVCGSSTDASRRSITELQEALADLDELFGAASRTRPMVDREIVDIERDLAKKEQEILSLRRKRQELETEAEKEDGAGQRLEDIYRFIGNVEQTLRNVREVEGDDGLEAKLDQVQREIGSLTAKLEERRQEEAERSALERISNGIMYYTEVMGIRNTYGTPVLDKRELNLKFVSEDRSDFLWEIGSGQNWMAYHIATLLALHGFFTTRGSDNPVPSFLVIDQPSQVYFPSDTYEDRVLTPLGEAGSIQRLDDLQRTRRIFETLSRAVRQNKGRLQIIVLEHADSLTWGDLENIHEVRNWRGDVDYLVPRDWLS